MLLVKLIVSIADSSAEKNVARKKMAKDIFYKMSQS